MCSSVRNPADRICVLEDGEVAELGSHDELIRLDDGVYRALYSLQAATS